METHNLLTTATESKSEIEITRECAITVLILALNQAEQQSNAFIETSQCISALGGEKVILNMCVSSDGKITSLLIIWCTLHLLECINKVKKYGNICGLNDHEVQLFCETLKNCVQDKSWIKSTNIYKFMYNYKIIPDIVSLLIILIAKLKLSAIIEKFTVSFQVERKLTAKSIC